MIRRMYTDSIAVGLGLLIVVAVVGGTVAAEPASLSADGPSDAAPGTTVTISFTVNNTGDATSAYVLEGSLPDGWTVVNHSDDGGIWKSSESTWLWQSVAAGNSVGPSVTIQVPQNATGTYTISGTLKDADGVQANSSTTINVGTSATPTTTTTETATTETDDESTDTLGPGFGMIMAIVAVIVTLLLLRHDG